MKKKYLSILFIAVTLDVSAQTLSPTVLSTLGGSFSSGGNSLSGTMGQTYSNTLQSAGNFVTQGFEQPELSLRPNAYPVTGGTNCASVGTIVGVANSETGVTYKLYLNGSTLVDGPISGTSGSAISFTATNPQTTPGTYTVIATNAIGNTTQMTGSAVVNANPPAATGLLSLALCTSVGSNVITFTVNDPGSGFLVLWSTDGSTNNDGFGTGGSGNLTKSHTVAVGNSVTEYAVIKNNTTGCVSSTFTLASSASGSSNQNPGNPTGFTDQKVCSLSGSGTATFTVTDPGAGNTVQWSTDGSTNNDGSAAGGSGNVTINKSVTLGSPVTEYARTSVNATGCTSAWVSATATGYVLTNATASNGTSPYCSYETISLGATPGSGTYNWSGPNSFSTTGQTPTRAASGNGGTYNVTVTDGNGCTSSASTVVVVNAAPTAGASSGSPYCSYNNITISTTPNGMTTYAWSGPGGYTSSSQSPAAFSATGNGGTYTVTVTDGNGCSSTSSTSVVVHVAPTASAFASGSSGTSGQFCSYDNIILSSNNAGMTTYSWTGPNTYTNSNQNPASFSASGNTGTYNLTVTDGNSCSSSASVAVVVNVPGVTAVVPTSSNVCSADVTALNASGGISYVWTPSTGLDGTLGALVDASPATNTTYTITGTDANGCTSSATSAFTVKPTPSISANPISAVCTGLVTVPLSVGGTVGSTYTWAPSTSLSTTTGTNVTTQIANLTFYTVTGTGSNGCTTSIVIPVATIPSGGLLTPQASVICSGGTKVLTATSMAGHDYQWQISSDDLNWTSITNATNTTYTTLGSDGNTKKYYRMLANSNACYNIASTAAIVDISTTPIVAITNVTSTTATVTWTPFGSGQYNISWSGGAGSGSAAALTSNVAVIGTGAYTPALTPNQPLLVTVTPVIPTCPGVVASSASTHTLCLAPTVTNVSATPFHGFQVNWTSVGSTAYRIFYRDLSTSSSWSFADVGAVTTTTIIVPYGGHTYAVYVAAKDCPTAGNIGDASTPINYVTTNPVSTCSPTPTVNTASNCPNQITVTMTGSTPPYNLELRRISPSLSSGASYLISTSSVSITLGTQYAGSTWEVFASKNCGSGNSSIISNVSIITVKSGCSSVNNVVLSHPTCNGFTATWNVGDCGSLSLTSYQLLIRKTGQVNFTGYPVGTNNYATVGWLIPGISYDVAVLAVSCNGATSAYSNIQTISSLPCGRIAEDESAGNNSNTVGNDKESVMVYPNPTQGQFWVSLGTTNTSEQTVKIEVINQLGQVIQTNLSQVTNGQMNQLVNTPEGLATGIYFVRTSVGGNVYVNRLMISKD